jgi:hypothetical protein
MPPARLVSQRAPARLAAPLAAAVLTLAAVAVAFPGGARGAEGLALVAHTTYVASPEEGRVHVSLSAVATALTPDTATERTFYTGLTLVIQPGAVDIASATANGSPLPITVIDSTDELITVEITFDRQVFYEESFPFTVTFDLPDPGGQPNREVRVGKSLVAFPVWAFGTLDTAGSDVEVRVPSGYEAAVEAGRMRATEVDGATVLYSGAIEDPLSWFAYVTAEAPGAFVEQALELRIGSDVAEVVVRAWEDDWAWSERMSDWMRAGIPALSQVIGLPWPLGTDLEVEEAATSRLGGYAGIYDDLRERIHVRYDADAFIALHEAAHAWFNSGLIDDRWIGEAFASLYAEEAGRVAGLDSEPYRLDGDPGPARIPLNAWGEIGTEDPETEDYAYAATYEVARRVADRATIEGLQPVWRAIADRHSAYQPIEAGAQPEDSGAVTQAGWQRLLDHVEEATDQGFDDIWREWVVTDAQAQLLDDRAAARALYAATLDHAAPWELPRGVRHVMAAWDFDDATHSLEQAAAVIEQRDRIEAEAADLRLAVPDGLRALFEGSSTFDAAAAEAIAERASLDLIDRATDRLSTRPGPLEMVGLLGSDPPAELAAARAAFEDGEGEAADAAARRAVSLRNAAPGNGRDRAIVAGAGLLALDGLVLVAVGAHRQRRQPVIEHRPLADVAL